MIDIHRCCIECTLHIDDSQNRFKQFLAFVPTNPAITHSLVAIAASHQAHSMASAPWATLLPTAEEQLHVASIGSDNFPTSDLALTQYSDALAHSASGAGSLRQALGRSDCSDALVATIFLLAWLDLVEDGLEAAPRWAESPDFPTQALAENKVQLIFPEVV